MTETLKRLLAEGLEDIIRGMNPWWRGEVIANVPPMRRWAFAPVRNGLESGLAPATVLRGPRQVGKTVLMNQVILALLEEGVSLRCIFRLNFDELQVRRNLLDPLLQLSYWYADTILGKSLNQAALDSERAFILFDEVQNLPDWAPQLKHLVDTNPVRVLVTGGSALRIEAGRDSLAGRISTLEMGPLLLREIAELRGFGRLAPFLPSNGLAPLKEKQTWRALVEWGKHHQELRQQAFAAFSARGGYPVAQVRAEQPWELVADFLNETVIRRAIQHDLRMGPRGQRRDDIYWKKCSGLPAGTLDSLRPRSCMSTKSSGRCTRTLGGSGF